MLEDSLSIKTDQSLLHHKPDSDDQRCRDLIAAIIHQAFLEAKANDFSAMSFINIKNKTFCFYCEILNLDPSWVAGKLQKIMREKDER